MSLIKYNTNNVNKILTLVIITLLSMTMTEFKYESKNMIKIPLKND